MATPLSLRVEAERRYERIRAVAIVEAISRNLDHGSSVFGEIILAYEVYARMLNTNPIRIMNPINDTVKALYETYGYRYVATGDYLSKEVL